MADEKIDEKLKDEIKIREVKYGYLPPEAEEKQEKTLIDEIIEWLKSKKGSSSSIEKIKKAL